LTDERASSSATKSVALLMLGIVEKRVDGRVAILLILEYICGQ
jgi:hypothetical protein